MQLVEWCDSYSPLAAARRQRWNYSRRHPAAFIYSAEKANLLLDVQWRLQRMGIKSRAAIADAWSIAWALARYGKGGGCSWKPCRSRADCFAG